MAIHLSPNIGSAFPSPELKSPGPAAPSQGGFRAVLENAIDRVELSRSQAQEMTGAFMNGENDELHSIAVATQRAELEFELLLQIRNKMVTAYQEIMRMQV